MKILILHANNDIVNLRRILLNYTYCLLKYAPEHEYFLHCCVDDPVTKRLKKEKFDIIIFDVAFLCYRYAGVGSSAAFLKKYEFLKESNAIKIALPQDEYNYTAVLDRWLSEWGTNVIFSIFPEYASLLFPLASQKAEIVQSYTGYVDKEDISIAEKHNLPFDLRTIDVGYRASNLPPNYGRLGYTKAKLGDKFIEACKNININLNFNVSNNKADTLVGIDWLKFLGNSKFTLGSESGSSILDPLGVIKQKVANYLSYNPEADFETVEAACFPGEDQKYTFNAISPRIFEAAIAGSCQILVEGKYQGIIKPYEHYISLKSDFSNISEVVEQMKDTENVKRIIDNCYNELIGSGNYTYRSFANKILEKSYQLTGIVVPENQFTDNKLFRKNIEKIVKLANKKSKKTGFAYIPPNLSCDTEYDINEIKKAHSIFGKYGKLKWF